MIYSAMPTLPVSDLRNRQAEIIKQLNETPILLTRGGYGAAVLVHPETWNQLIRELTRLQHLVEYDKGLAELKAGNHSESL